VALGDVHSTMSNTRYTESYYTLHSEYLPLVKHSNTSKVPNTAGIQQCNAKKEWQDYKSPFHPPRFDNLNSIWWRALITTLLIMQCFHRPVTSSVLGPNIFLSTIFSNALCLCFHLNVKDEVPHSYKTTGNIALLCISTLICLWVYSKLRNKILCRKVVGILRFILLLNSLCLKSFIT
jgi:hypothetical protein